MQEVPAVGDHQRIHRAARFRPGAVDRHRVACSFCSASRRGHDCLELARVVHDDLDARAAVPRAGTSPAFARAAPCSSPPCDRSMSNTRRRSCARSTLVDGRGLRGDVSTTASRGAGPVAWSGFGGCRQVVRRGGGSHRDSHSCRSVSDAGGKLAPLPPPTARARWRASQERAAGRAASRVPRR